MTANSTRASLLVRALRAGVAGDTSAIPNLYTRDVVAWSPWMSAGSAEDLEYELEHRDGTFTDLHLDVVPLDVGGDYACAEWTLTMTHAGDLTLPSGSVLAATDARITIYGVTVAEFHGDRICALRQYCDELAVLEQLGVAPAMNATKS